MNSFLEVLLLFMIGFVSIRIHGDMCNKGNEKSIIGNLIAIVGVFIMFPGFFYFIISFLPSIFVLPF